MTPFLEKERQKAIRLHEKCMNAAKQSGLHQERWGGKCPNCGNPLLRVSLYDAGDESSVSTVEAGLLRMACW